MAVVQNPIVGRARGKVANSVFTKWKNLNIWKSKALSVANPQTDGQLKQRARFSIITMLASIMLAAVRKGFNEYSGTMSESNMFSKINHQNDFLAWDGSQWVPDFNQLEIAKGSLDNTACTVTGITNGSTSVTIAFPVTASGNQTTGDYVNAVVKTPTDTVISIGAQVRNDGTLVVALPTALATGGEVFVYTFFTSADGRKNSDSQVIQDTV